MVPFKTDEKPAPEATVSLVAVTAQPRQIWRGWEPMPLRKAERLRRQRPRPHADGCSGGHWRANAPRPFRSRELATAPAQRASRGQGVTVPLTWCRLQVAVCLSVCRLSFSMAFFHGLHTPPPRHTLTTKGPTRHRHGTTSLSHTSQVTPQSPPVTKTQRLHRPGRVYQVQTPHPRSSARHRL